MGERPSVRPRRCMLSSRADCTRRRLPSASRWNVAACASVPPASPSAGAVPVVTWEQKLGWIVRLEDQRILRDPNPPSPVILKPATQREPALVAPGPPSIWSSCSTTTKHASRRAALAIGRVGLSEGIEPLTRLLNDEEIEVRQMAAFGLGLIGDAAARSALLAALKDPQPLLQGRAAEALGQSAIAPMATQSARWCSIIKAGALMGIAPDDLTYPLSAPAEAVRLGLYALARLGVRPIGCSGPRQRSAGLDLVADCLCAAAIRALRRR